MILPKELTTVTPLSKFLALILFIIFPLVGFVFGMQYQYTVDLYNRQLNDTYPATITRHPTPTPSQIGNLKIYTNSKYHYSLLYPIIYQAGSGGSGSPVQGDETSLVISIHETGHAGFPIFYVNIVSKDGSNINITYNADGFTNNVRKYLSVNLGNTVKPPNQPWGEEFTRLPDIEINGKKAIVFEACSYGKKAIDCWKDRRIILEKDKYIYVIGTYYRNEKDDSWNGYDQILSTFRFY